MHFRLKFIIVFGFAILRQGTSGTLFDCELNHKLFAWQKCLETTDSCPKFQFCKNTCSLLEHCLPPVERSFSFIMSADDLNYSNIMKIKAMTRISGPDWWKKPDWNLHMETLDCPHLENLEGLKKIDLSNNQCKHELVLESRIFFDICLESIIFSPIISEISSFKSRTKPETMEKFNVGHLKSAICESFHRLDSELCDKYIETCYSGSSDFKADLKNSVLIAMNKHLQRNLLKYFNEMQLRELMTCPEYNKGNLYSNLETRRWLKYFPSYQFVTYRYDPFSYLTMQQNTISTPRELIDEPEIEPLKQKDPDAEIFSVTEVISNNEDDVEVLPAINVPNYSSDPVLVTGSSEEEDTITNLSVRSLEDPVPTAVYKASDAVGYYTPSVITDTNPVETKVRYYDSDVVDLTAESISTVPTILKISPNVAYYDPDLLGEVDHVEGVKSSAWNISLKVDLFYLLMSVLSLGIIF